MLRNLAISREHEPEFTLTEESHLMDSIPQMYFQMFKMTDDHVYSLCTNLRSDKKT